MKELSAPKLDNQPWCIEDDTLEVNFEVKIFVVHHLSKFGGLPGEAAMSHLKEFH